MGVGVGVRVGSGVSSGVTTGVNVGVGVGVTSGVSAGVGVGSGVGDGSAVGVGVTSMSSSASAEAVGTSIRKESGWEENDEEILGTNRYGFGAVPAGYRDANGSFAFLGEEADFWVAEEDPNGTQAPHWNLYYANQNFSGEYRNLKTFGFSVRCIKK